MSDTLDARCRAWEDEQRRLDASWISRSVPVRKGRKGAGAGTRALTSETFPWQMSCPAHPLRLPADALTPRPKNSPRARCIAAHRVLRRRDSPAPEHHLRGRRRSTREHQWRHLLRGDDDFWLLRRLSRVPIARARQEAHRHGDHPRPEGGRGACGQVQGAPTDPALRDGRGGDKVSG